jgi:Ala-tRNA(Pro) deacylase
VLGEDDIGFSNEDELSRTFPDCEIGAMPPFPRLWRLPSVLDPCFDEEADLCFNAGNHAEVVRMAFAEFYRLAGPFTHEGCVHTQQIHA